MYAGIDIGSISAKMVISGEDGSILHSDYLYHRGEPAGTVGRLCRAARKAGFSRYRALCVTGSGRNYIGECLDADLVKNEITATWEAARVLLPEANTIIEIGGQDSKLISWITAKSPISDSIQCARPAREPSSNSSLTAWESPPWSFPTSR